MSWSLVAAPAGQLISLQEAKQQCRVDGDEEDELLQRAIDTAVSWLDGYRGVLGRCILNQSWRLTALHGVGMVRFPFPDVSSVSVQYGDDEGGDAPYAVRGADRIDLRGTGGRPVMVTVVAGFGSLANVPPAIKSAALLLVDHLYNDRGDGGGLPTEVDQIISPFRVWRV